MRHVTMRPITDQLLWIEVMRRWRCGNGSLRPGVGDVRVQVRYQLVGFDVRPAHAAEAFLPSMLLLTTGKVPPQFWPLARKVGGERVDGPQPP